MKITEVKCIPMQLKPGDKLLVKLSAAVLPEQILKIKRTVQSWAGPDVAVLVVPPGCEIIKEESPIGR